MAFNTQKMHSNKQKGIPIFLIDKYIKGLWCAAFDP